MPYFIGPGYDLILGFALGIAVFFTATDSWWTVPHIWRKLVG